MNVPTLTGDPHASSFRSPGSLRVVSRPQPTAASEAARLQTYPPPYPDSWYVLCRSGEVKDNVLSVHALGQRFVVFRDAEGVAVVLDAHCPHLGADLGLGRVVDGCVECPFHRLAEELGMW